MNKNDIVNDLYTSIYEKMTDMYLTHLEIWSIDTNLGLGMLPPQQAKEKINHFIQLNTIGNTEILRVNIDCQIFSIRAKHLYNTETKESYINLVDFSVNKIQLRTGGFGTKIINCCFDLQRNWLKQLLQIEENKTKMYVFKFLSMPFWLKNGFKFKQLVPNIICHKENDQNTLFKLFKLFILMSSTLDLGQHVPQYSIFSLEIAQISLLINKQISGYYRKMYNQCNFLL